MLSARARFPSGLLLAAALLGARAEAEPSLRVLHGGGSALVAGETAEVLFDTALLAGSDESELVLSLDGGASYPVRLTRSKAESDGRAAFRVPAFAARHARLALRGGFEDGERLVAESDELAIESGPSAALEPLRRSSGEWTTREASDGPAEPPGGFEAPAPTVSPLESGSDAAAPPSIALAGPSGAPRRDASAAARPRIGAGAAPLPPLSVSLPKRE